MNVLKQNWILVCYEQPFHPNQEFQVKGDEFHYLTHVLRLKMNDSIELSNGIGGKAVGVISRLTKKECILNIIKVWNEPQKIKVHLMLAQLKSSAMEDSIFAASELGGSTVHLFRAERSVSKQAIKIQKMQKISNEAIRISKSGYSAKIFEYENLHSCISNLQNLNKVCFLFCDEESKEKIIHFKLYKAFENICVIVGPESSFSISERSKILELPNSFSVSLGSHILRAPTAVTCACFAALSLES